jgi:hypothetical protein
VQRWTWQQSKAATLRVALHSPRWLVLVLAVNGRLPPGPLVFLLCFGFALLLKGKIQFGFIYGLGMMGCGSIWLLLNLMSHDIDLATSTSILGYCLLPMVAVAYLSLIFKGLLLTILVTFSIALCTWRATSMFVSLFRFSPSPVYDLIV